MLSFERVLRFFCFSFQTFIARKCSFITACCHQSFINIHCKIGGKNPNRKPQIRGRRSDLSVRQQTTAATPLCLCLRAGVCWLNSRRSSWLKGTKPHRNTWLGSVWPATARRVASAAWARESRRNGGVMRWGGEREGYRGIGGGRREERRKEEVKEATGRK